MTRIHVQYLITTVVAWMAIWLAKAFIVDAQSFRGLIPVLGGATAFFVVLVPAVFFQRR